MRYRLFLALYFLLFASGCATSTPAPLEPQVIIQKASLRMSALDGFHFVIDRTGSPAFLDPSKTYSFRRAEGDFAAPNQAQANVRIIGPGLVAEIQCIGLGDKYWETNILTGEWVELPPAQGFNPAVLFDPEIGFQTIIENDIIDLIFVGNEELEELPGKLLYTVSGEMKGEHIYTLSYGLIGPDDMDVKIWIDPDSFDIHKIQITQVHSDTEPTTWQIDFWDFDQQATISSPEI